MRVLLQQSTQGVASGRVHLSRILFLLTFLLTAGASPASSQEVQRVEKLTIALWPEYDRPAVLVTYRVQLAPDVAFPAQIALPVPTHVGVPHAIAKLDADGKLYVVASTREIEGDWATVTVTTDSPDIHLEYYAPILASGHARNFIFRWPGGLEIAHLHYEVLEPKHSTNLAVMPSPTDENMTDFGVMIQHAELGTLSATQDATIALTYDNPSAQLSIPPAAVPNVPAALPAQPPSAAARPTPPATEPSSGTSSIQITLIVVGVAVAFIGGLWLGRSRGSDLAD